MTTAPIRKPVPKKPPAKRLFTGVAGSPLAGENTEKPVQGSQTKGLLVKCSVPECYKYIFLPAGKPSFIFICKQHRDQAPKKKIYVDEMFCTRHAKPEPCPRCDEEAHRWMRFGEQNRYAHLMNQFLGTAWGKVAEQTKVFPVPPVGDWKSIDSSYDAEKYRHEINTGLRYAKSLLREFPESWKGFDDLKQITDIEIWLASRKYGAKMNGAIAYTIAKNQAGRFLKNQINEQMIVVENSNGSIVLDESGKPMKVRRSLSFDDKGTDENGEPKDISDVEETIGTRSDVRHNYTEVFVREEHERKAWMDDIRRKIPLLEKLVSSWFGTKRAVGEALLENPECSVRDIPGVPKSTAARVRQAVLAEFRAIIDDSAISQSTENTEVNV
jgi:hypothetical protein